MAIRNRRSRIRWLVVPPLALLLVATGYGLRIRFAGNARPRPPLVEGPRRPIDPEAWLEALVVARANHPPDDEEEASGDDSSEEADGTIEESGEFGDGELRVVRHVRRGRVVKVEPVIIDGFEDETVYGHLEGDYEEGGGYDDDGFDDDDEYQPPEIDEGEDGISGNAGSSGSTEPCTGNLLCVVASAAGAPPASLPYGSVRAWKQASEGFRKGDFRAAASGFAHVAETPMPQLPPVEVAALRRLLCVQAAAAWLADPDRVLGATAVRAGAEASDSSSELGSCAPSVDALLGRRARGHARPEPVLTHL